MNSLPRVLETMVRLIKERDQLLDALPRCRCQAGQCLPHALEWIRQARQGLQPIEKTEEQPMSKLENRIKEAFNW